jgi:hypothetical protein
MIRRLFVVTISIRLDDDAGTDLDSASVLPNLSVVEDRSVDATAAKASDTTTAGTNPGTASASGNDPRLLLFRPSPPPARFHDRKPRDFSSVCKGSHKVCLLLMKLIQQGGPAEAYCTGVAIEDNRCRSIAFTDGEGSS